MTASDLQRLRALANNDKLARNPQERLTASTKLNEETRRVTSVIRQSASANEEGKRLS